MRTGAGRGLLATGLLATGLLAAVLLAGCGAGTGLPAPTPTPTATPTPQNNPGSGTITREWSESVTQSGGGSTSVIRQAYKAVVLVNLTKVDIRAWTIDGKATITATFTSDFQSQTSTPLGPCNVHYTDDASGAGNVDVEGGMEAGDGTYEFHVNIPGLDGSNNTVRDDSGCFGGTNRETTPWPVAPDMVGGSGNYSGNGISGNTSKPREGGKDAASWSFSITP